MATVRHLCMDQRLLGREFLDQRKPNYFYSERDSPSVRAASLLTRLLCDRDIKVHPGLFPPDRLAVISVISRLLELLRAPVTYQACSKTLVDGEFQCINKSKLLLLISKKMLQICLISLFFKLLKQLCIFAGPE